jgi:glutamate/tyrosine decarboxylase-like PLP-dependent enzyme
MRSESASPEDAAAGLTPPPRLDDLNWDSDRTREFAAKATDLFARLIDELPELPVSREWEQEEVERALSINVPDAPMADDELIAYLERMLFEYSVYCGHPRFMAYVSGTGTVPGAVADMIAAGVNMNVGGWRLSPAATEVELALMRWFAQQFGLPPAAGGLMVSGGAMANFVALKIARDVKATWDIRREGMMAGPPMTMYGSEETHVVSDRAADMLGLGTEALRKIPMDEGLRIRTDVLRESIARDRAEGRLPVAVVASAGTVGAGAIDPLPEIADICSSEGLWFHVDAAYGGPAVLADDLRPLFAGIERADSIAFDPHKWLYIPHSAGCVLIRESTYQGVAFLVAPPYIHLDEEHEGHGVDMGGLGPQFSRGFQALKVWVSLLAHGRQAYADRISHDAALARYMGAKVEAHPELELAAPVGLSICCFRYVPQDLEAGPERELYVSLINERLMGQIQADGRAFVSNALLDGRWALRACIVNFRTEASDIDATLDVAVELGRALDAEMRPESLRASAL